MNEMLPPEYQAEIERLNQRRKLAQLMQSQGATPQMASNSGRMMSKTSPFAVLAQSLVGQGGGAYLDNQASEQQAGVRERYNTDSNADMARVLGLPEAEQPNAAQLSKFPTVQALAKELQNKQEKRRELKSGVFKDAGDTPSALAILDGTPAPEPKKPMQPQVKLETGPNGKPVMSVINYDKHGVPKQTLGSGEGATMSVNMPNKEADLAIGQIGDNLKERRGKAQAAQSLYSSIGYAVDALESGAQAGGGEETKQFLRKGLQAFNINLPETASTEQLQQAMLKGVLDNAAALRPASDTDLKILKEMAGSASTDPKALTKALAFAQSMAVKDLHGYNQYVGENQKNLNPNIQGMFAGATSGYKVPQQFNGPTGYQLEIIRNLQRQGVDISMFNDPDGKPFAKGAKFNVDPTKGFPGINPDSAAKAEDAPLDAAQLKRYEELRKKYKR